MSALPAPDPEQPAVPPAAREPVVPPSARQPAVPPAAREAAGPSGAREAGRDAVEGLVGLGTELARTPLRLLAPLAEPIRADVGGTLRRAVGTPKRPAPGTAPGRPFLPEDAVTRRVHGDLPSMLIGGLAALLLQTLHPLAMAGVAEHSEYAADPIGRLRRTAFFVGATTFGTVEEAEAAIVQVQRVHESIRGRAPDGRAYAADDPELLTWVHAAEVSSFLVAAQRFGTARLSAADTDRYYAEAAEVAYRLGATWVPASATEVDAYFRRMRPSLYAGDQALQARDFLLRGVARRPGDRLVHTCFAAAAVSLLPGWARRLLHLPAPPLADRVLITPAVQALCHGLRWAVRPA